MGLTLVTGRANAGKTGILHEALISGARDGVPVLLLPQAPDVRRAEREFAALGTLGVRAAVLDDWIAELWSLHGDGRRLVKPAARTAMLSAVISDTQLEALAESAKTPGFVRLVSGLARRLARVPPVPQDPIAAEVAGILHAYHGRLSQRGLIELVQVADALVHTPPDISGPIAVNRFMDLSHSQEAFLLAVSTVTEVLIALTWEEDSASTEGLSALVRRLKSAGAIHRVVHETAWTDEGLAQLEGALFEERPPISVTGVVEWGEVIGVEAECALVARLAREALDAGGGPGDVAIAFRDVAPRAHMLSSALRAEGIDAAVDVAMEFEKTPFGAAFLSLITACRGGEATRERLLGFLLSPYCEASVDEVAALDLCWRRGRTHDDELIRSVSSALPGARGVIERARALSGRTIDTHCAHEWKVLADQLLSSAHRRRGMSASEALMDAPAHGTVLRVAGELAELDAESTDTDLVAALQYTSVPSGTREEISRVLVTEAHRLKGRRFETVILGGLNADEFAPQRDESLADSLAARLGETSGTDSALVERLLFYVMVTRARRRLALVRQAVSERGEPTRASAFWEEMLDVYRTPEEAAAAELPQGLEIRRLTAAEVAISAPAILPNRRHLREDPITHAPVAPHRGRLVEAGAIQTLASREEFSVTEIETYLACPYSWFFRYVVRPQEIDREFDARERGSRAHEILRRFYGEWTDAGKGRVCPDDVDEALELLERIDCEDDEGCGSTTARCLEDELSVAKARAWARNVVLDDVWFLGGFTPTHHELRFGARLGVPVRFFDVALSGSIDRVDVSDKGLLVVDYKSASTVHGHRTFAHKGLVQIPVYSAVAAQLLHMPALGGLYRSMRTLSCRGFWDRECANPGMRGSEGDGTDAAGVRSIIEYAGERVQMAIEGMRSGIITPHPIVSGACTHCDARTVCGEAR